MDIFIKAKKFFLLLVLVCLVLNLNAETFKVSVKVKRTEKAVEYATICWESISDRKVQGYTVADKQGNASIELSNNGPIAISVACLGYVSLLDTVNLQNNQIFHIKQDLLNLEQVTVTGTRTQHTLKNAPVLTQVINSQEIQNIGATTVTDILNAEVPGMETEMHGYGQAISVQGMEGKYTLILVDGERLAGETDGNIDYSRLNAANIDRIEIIRGASSALYGSSAIGGVINIITKKPKRTSVSASVRYAEYNQKNYDSDKSYENSTEKEFYKKQDRPNLNANILVDYKYKNFYSSTLFNYKSTDGYYLVDKDRFSNYYAKLDTTVYSDFGSTTISGFMDYTINEKLGYDDGDKWKVDLKGNYYQHEECPVLGYSFVKDTTSGLTVSDKFSSVGNDGKHDLYKNYTLSGNVQYKIPDGSFIKLSHNSDIYNKYDVIDATQDETMNYRNIYHNTKFNYSFYLGDKNHLFTGIENLYESLETDMFISDASKLLTKSTDDAVVVLQDEYKITNKLETVLGLRSGYHSTFKFHSSPSVSLKYNLKPFNLRLNYAKGYRSPALKELYMNWSMMGMFQIVGNTDLDPETNNYYAFSIDYLNVKKNLDLTLIASYNVVKDKIEAEFLSDSVVTYVNQDKVKVFNIETLLKWRIDKNFNFKAGYVYNHLTKTSDAISMSDVSPHAVSTQLEYIFRTEKFRFNANIQGKYLSEKTVSEINDNESSVFYNEIYEHKYAAYSLWNLTFNMGFGAHFSFITGAKNLFDYTSPTVTMNTSPTVGRRCYVTLKYQY